MSPQAQNIGPYQLLSELGHGAMAHVWRAWDPNLERKVAIKIPSFNSNLPDAVLEEMSRRFVAEGRAAARLSHPGIVTVYAADVWDGVAAIVMELVEGSTLTELLSKGPLSPAATLNILDQLLDAVGYAHARGIVHRDIKPDNIFVSNTGIVKLADFGIAHIDNAAMTHATVAGTVLGTPGYMSPEQARGTAVDARSDLFSVGVIAHEMLTGRNPFGAGFESDPTTLIYRIVHEPAPELPNSVAQALPADMRPAIMAALSKDPNDRPATAADFKMMLHGQLSPSTAQSGYQTMATNPIPNIYNTTGQYADPTTTRLPDDMTAGTGGGKKTPSWLPYALVGGVCAIGLAIALVSAMGGSGGGGGGGGSNGFYLSLYDGNVAIYSSTSAEPYEVTSVSVADLSPEDAALLGGRIPVASLDEAQARVQQYEDAIEAVTEADEQKALEEARRKAEEEAQAVAEAEAKAKAEAEAAAEAAQKAQDPTETLTIAVTGADGTTRTETIRRDRATQRVIPDSNSRLLSSSEVQALSDAERCIAWNEIIAASNGYAFKNGTLASYFGECSWYSRNPDASSSGNLSDNASRNVGMLQDATSEWWKHLATN